MNEANGIDIELILKKKFGKAPRLLTWYLKRLIHQDFLNGFFAKGYSGVEFCTRALEQLDISLTVEGSIPEGGPYTFVSNHPLGGVDGLALLHLIGQKNPDIMMLGNDILTNIQGLAPMIVPISKVGMQSRTLKDNIDQAFSSKANILVLPAGKVSRKTDGLIQDQFRFVGVQPAEPELCFLYKLLPFLRCFRCLIREIRHRPEIKTKFDRTFMFSVQFTCQMLHQRAGICPAEPPEVRQEIIPLRIILGVP